MKYASSVVPIVSSSKVNVESISDPLASVVLMLGKLLFREVRGPSTRDIDNSKVPGGVSLGNASITLRDDGPLRVHDNRDVSIQLP